MGEKIGKFKYTTITLVFWLVLFFNFLSWNNLAVGITLGVAWLIFYSFIAGSIIRNKQGWPASTSLGGQIIFGLLFLLSIIIISSAGFIYLYQFNDYAFILLIILIPVLLFIPYYHNGIREKFSTKKIIKNYLAKFSASQKLKSNAILALLYLLSALVCFFLLAQGQTVESIQTPWAVVSNQFFIFYFLSTAILVTYLFNSAQTKLPLTLLVIHTFLSSSVALIVYKIGYGFDPFIHQATEKIIAQTGTITPTPFYYLGQYGLVIFLNKLTTLNIELIDRLLVPVLFALTVPLSIFYVLSHWLEKNYALVLSLLVLVIPFSGFIMTAPQNLANLFFIITIFLSLLYFRNQIKVWLLYLLALATLAIHPLAGLPLLIVVILLNLFKLLYYSYIKYISLYFLAGLVFILFLPLAFILNGSEIIPNLPTLHRADFAWFGWVDKFDLPLNLVYLINLNKIVIVSLIILIGLIYIAKNKLLKNNAGYLMASFVIFADFIIVKYFLTFPDLRDFDKDPFVNRLALLTFYILLPFFLIGLYWLIKKFWTNPPMSLRGIRRYGRKDVCARIFLIFILAGTLTISLYLSYPRVNQYEPAKFFSLSASDIKTVNSIEQSAQPEHIVLANQMVGVAAIKEFGFKKYYNNQFYYSMPMGTPRTFYDYYLEMIYEGAKKETMTKAMTEAGVTESYFVLNKYWRNSEKIKGQAAESADKVYEIDEGKIWIFKYTR